MGTWRRLKIVFAICLGGPVALAAVLALFGEAFYFFCLLKVDELPGPPSRVWLDERLSRALWLSMEEGDHFQVVPRSPGRLIRFCGNKRWWASPGSALAGQLARSWLHRGGRTIPGKALGRMGREWATTVWLTRHWSAAELTQGVSETQYFGRRCYGLQAASWRYFGKDAGALAPHELAMLVALPQSPVRLDPELHPDPALRARNRMLERFVQAGLITEAEAETAKLKPLGARPR